MSDHVRKLDYLNNCDSSLYSSLLVLWFLMTSLISSYIICWPH